MEARTALGVPAAKVTPQDVMNAILKAPVDLLWFGGIGTYVRASAESDDSVGDRANDAIRAAAAQLRCKVIREGPNPRPTPPAPLQPPLPGTPLTHQPIA